MSALARKPDVPTLTCPVHPDREMQLFQETRFMQIWGCWGCKALPKKKRRLFSGIFVVRKDAGLRVPTPAERLDILARRERQRMAAEKDAQIRHEDAERRAMGLPSEDEEHEAAARKRHGE